MKLKIKPTRNTIALRKVKFRKESDFNKFLKIVSKNTKELERVKLPSKSDIKKKSGFNLLPILALGALLAGLAGLSKKNKKDTDGVEVPDLNIGNEIDSISNVSMKIKSDISKKKIKKTKTDRKTKRVRNKNKRRNIKRRINSKRKINITSASKSASTAVQLGLVGLPIDVQQYLTGSTTSQLPGTSTTNKLPRNAASRLRTVSDLEYRRLQIKNKIKPALNAAKVVTSVVKGPQALAGTLIVNDIMNNSLADGSMEAHGYVMTTQGWVHKDKLIDDNPWVYSPGKGYESMAERKRKSLDKEMDQLHLQRQALDPKDTKNYKILTDKIADLALQRHNITPELMEQNFIKASFNNPIILYPIDESQNLMPNTPNFYSPPQSQSQAGNGIVGGESDVVNISELLLLNKLSH